MSLYCRLLGLYIVRDMVSTATIMSKDVNVYAADQDKTGLGRKQSCPPSRYCPAFT